MRGACDAGRASYSFGIPLYPVLSCGGDEEGVQRIANHIQRSYSGHVHLNYRREGQLEYAGGELLWSQEKATVIRTGAVGSSGWSARVLTMTLDIGPLSSNHSS